MKRKIISKINEGVMFKIGYSALQVHTGYRWKGTLHMYITHVLIGVMIYMLTLSPFLNLQGINWEIKAIENMQGYYSSNFKFHLKHSIVNHSAI